ncbi:Cation/H(+) antiporter 1 [Dichanthelium oligosanthes]|uniref:Cation/H(+) antiporter 1 n=1 Tax=Dichanthelium oligosanthes TaxID=888268 RepID=A0A1E5VS65_9POAL|nr:Cation/H(+) antiporter 1 [Dichanthelium oligosanthes]
MADNGDANCSAAIGEGAYFMAGIIAITGIMATVLVLSRLFHSALRRLGQPSIISHILAGIMVGPTVLGHAMDLRELGMQDAGRALSGTIYFVRMVFMFFIGLELDLRYLRHNLRRSLAVACGGSAFCFVLAVLAGPFSYGILHPGQGPFQPAKLYASTALFALVLTSTASPVLIRIVTELKLTGSEVGQLAIGAAFANDMASLTALSVIIVTHTVYGGTVPKEDDPSPQAKAAMLALMALTVWMAVSLTSWVARLLNRLKRGRQYISKYELCGMLFLIMGLCLLEQVVGYSASMTAFLIGLAMPREGPTTRTLMDHLAYPVHQLVMPLCFGAIGARLDFAQIGSFTARQIVLAVTFTTLLSVAGKVAGTVLAGRALGIAPREAVVLGALLNVKGYSDILAINFGNKVHVWGEAAQVVLLLSSIISTFMAGPASAAIVRQQRRAFQYRSRCLQDLMVDHELRVLVCVHVAAGVHPMLTLANLSKGNTLVAVYLLHLVELVTSHKYAITHQLYHARDGGQDEDEWGYAREIEQVDAAVAAFTYDNAIPVRQMTAISNLVSMDTDVRNNVEDARASLVIMPFHKEQRYDGRMVCRSEGRRLLNQRILQRALCTVGILVERRFTQEVTGEHLQVMALFLGGADDREAVAYAARLAMQSSLRVTVCRFLLPSGKGLLGNQGTAEEAMRDEEFMADMYARFVAPGQLTYMERYVSNGADTVNALNSMVGKYALFIIGNGSKADGDRGTMTSDMGGWDEECPELGPIGEMLASDDLEGCGSVLVLQQHNMYPKPKMRTWNNDSQECHPQDQHHQADVADAIVDILGSSSSTTTNCSLQRS